MIFLWMEIIAWPIATGNNKFLLYQVGRKSFSPEIHQMRRSEWTKKVLYSGSELLKKYLYLFNLFFLLFFSSIIS